jgi:MYXO-CTERM domain-containing protein
VCEPCSSDDQCGGENDLCVPYPVGPSRCGAVCDRDEHCADVPGCEGRDCRCYELTDSDAKQCVPEGFSCDVEPECDDDNPCVGDLECVDGQCVPHGCWELGDECDEHEDCCSSMCLDGQCSQACDWLRPDESCPSGFYCMIQECGVGACKPGRLGGGGRGSECESHEECSTGYCAATGGPTTCQTACDPDGLNTCPDDWSCTRIGASSCGLCSCQIGALGDPCVDRGDCASGLCARAELCTRRCSEGSNPCPAGYDCLEAGDVSICWPTDGAFGAECTEDDDCTDGRCVAERCTRECGSDCDCPRRYECTEVDGDDVCQEGDDDDDGDGGGCNCAAGGRPAPGNALLGLLVLLGAVARFVRRGRA